MKNLLLGVGREYMSNIGFSFMAFGFKLSDMFFPVDQFVMNLGIQSGFTVIDYGCGPGSYVNKTAELVGKKGKVYAVDIHEMALKAVEKRIKKYQLTNVEPVLATGYCCHLNDQTADVIFAFDMFHMIEEPTAFLKELHRLVMHRLVKRGGYLIIDDGHQPRDEARRKLKNAGVWNIEAENKKYLKCKPIYV